MFVVLDRGSLRKLETPDVVSYARVGSLSWFGKPGFNEIAEFGVDIGFCRHRLADFLADVVDEGCFESNPGDTRVACRDAERLRDHAVATALGAGIEERQQQFENVLFAETFVFKAELLGGARDEICAVRAVEHQFRRRVDRGRLGERMIHIQSIEGFDTTGATF